MERGISLESKRKLGRVSELFQGSDGNICSARITRGDASYENHTAPISYGTFFDT